MSAWVEIVSQAWRGFLDDRCPRLAAALAFYTFFSLPPLLMLVTMLAGVFVSGALAEARIFGELEKLLGSEAATQVQHIIRDARHAGGTGVVPGVLGVAAVAFGATRAFAVLQEALNVIWDVPAHRGFRQLLGKRLVSFAMILVLVLLLLVSLAATTVARAGGAEIARWLPWTLSPTLVQVLPTALDLLLLPVFFATLFVLLPDVRIPWRSVWVGAAITALCFEAGKLGTGLYLARVDPGSIYGAAGTLVALLLWVYYSAMAVFLGAEIAHVWTRERLPARG